MENYSIKEIKNICSRCLTKDNIDMKNFVDVFNFYLNKNNSKKLDALSKIFNQCFYVERQWFYDDSVDESKLVGYRVYLSLNKERISIMLKNQSEKIAKQIFEESNANVELKESINELES